MISFVIRLQSRAHFTVGRGRRAGGEAFVGTNAWRRKQARQRVAVITVLFFLSYLAVGARLVQYGMTAPEISASIAGGTHVVASRPDIVDRNGLLLATDLNTMSLYAEPRRIVDADEVVEKLATVVPNLDWNEVGTALVEATMTGWGAFVSDLLDPKTYVEVDMLDNPALDGLLAAMVGVGAAAGEDPTVSEMLNGLTNMMWESLVGQYLDPAYWDAAS